MENSRGVESGSRYGGKRGNISEKFKGAGSVGTSFEGISSGNERVCLDKSKWVFQVIL